MKLKLIREVLNDKCTIGKLYIDGVFFAHTLEDVYREIGADGSGKIPKETCIPDGTYKVILSMSNRFKKIMPEILSVPHFKGVRIHGGNTKEDTEGCPCIGAHTDGVFKIWSCKDKVTSLIAYLKAAGGSCMIEIIRKSVAEAVLQGKPEQVAA